MPAGVTVYRSPTVIGRMGGRTLTKGVADYAAVHKFQAGIKAIPLSAWGKPDYVAPAGKYRPEQDMSSPHDQVNKMDAVRFFTLFTQLLHNNQPHANDYPQLARLARLGIAPDQAFEFTKLAPEVQAALQAAPENARKKMALAAHHLGNLSNGWIMLSSPIGTYGADYTRRATMAQFGLGANLVEDNIYPTAFNDADGKPSTARRST